MKLFSTCCVLLSGVSAHDRRGRIFKEGKSMDDEHKIVEGMLRRNPSDNHTFVGLIPNEDEEPGGSDEGAEGGALFGSKAAKEAKLTAMGGMNTAQTVIAGDDNAVRMLKREGIIDKAPSSLCEDLRSTGDDEEAPPKKGKNVILVVGDGTGWEMIRAGAVAKQVIAELEELGVDIKEGATGDIAAAAKEAFAGRTLDDYYTEGKGSGLSFQDLPDFSVVTNSVPFVGEANPGNHYGPGRSFLGDVDSHDNGMGELLVGLDGNVLVFDPRDISEGGNMVRWDDEKGGEYPWDANYFKLPAGESIDDKFDPEHAIDSANSATAYSIGVKTGVSMLGVDLYEQPVRNILEEAMACGKAGGVVTSVQLLDATPGAFLTHSLNRKNKHHLQDGFMRTQPSWAMGICDDKLQPSEEMKASMVNGSLSSSWTFLHQDENVLAEDFYNDIQDKNPDNGDHVLACFGGVYTTGISGSGEKKGNMPFRGLDSSYSNRWCSAGIVVADDNDIPTDITPNSTICDHWPQDSLKNVPHMQENVKEALNFLGKDKDGFFMLYEQGDIDWAAHGNAMDDMLGALLDMDESVAEIMKWIDENGGYEKNALFVTADHDHYLTLLPHFPEVVANMIIDGHTHDMTPENNTSTNTWDYAIQANRHNDDTKTQTEHLKDYSTWTDEDIQNVAHYFGPWGSGGNGWGSHSARPIVNYHGGDDGCLEAFTGKGYRVLGRDVEGTKNKVDQVHVHACMMKSLFGL